MKTITIDQKSISAASAGQLDINEITEKLALPQPTDTTVCVVRGDHGYILSKGHQPGDALLVISLATDGPITDLSADDREEAFGRLLRCTMMLIEGRSRSIPSSWRPFHQNNRLTFHANRLVRQAGGGRVDTGRIAIEIIQQDSRTNIFAFLLDREKVLDLAKYKPNVPLLKEALAGVVGALVRPDEETAVGLLGNSMTLDKVQNKGQVSAVSYKDWYTTLLTTAQRKFVEHPMTGGVRLVGPAGTGKTVSLVVKCLTELNKAVDEGKARRFLFLTHASSTAYDVENKIMEMDAERGLDFLASDRPSLVVSTLNSLANAHMQYNLEELAPVSLDGQDGQETQAIVLNDAIEEFRRGDWIAFKYACSAPFVSYMESPKDSQVRRFFLWSLLNEFACVLDADGVRSGVERRNKYLKDDRKKWMMTLQTKEERQVVLALYDSYRRTLIANKAIGSDQMIADYLTYLDGFRWEASRKQEGFDAIFVDELHLFNRQERLTFRNLLKDPDGPALVFFAYDAKQSPRDTFLGTTQAGAGNMDFWKDARLGSVEKIELVDVFRYTPQVARALNSIDQYFPGLDLDDEWPAYRGVSRIADGPVPTLCNLDNLVVTYAFTFKRASVLQGMLSRGKRVAILCVSRDLFVHYTEFKDLRDRFHAITSRDDLPMVSRGSKKFIFSMPEYVAGLQFDTVLLIDVNRSEVPEGPQAVSLMRKFVSQVYLGASRAERVLEIYSNAEQGGSSSLLTRAELEGSIKIVTIEDLK